MAASPHKDAFLVPAYSDFVVWEAGIFLSGAEKYVREIYSQVKRQRQDANRKKQLGWDVGNGLIPDFRGFPYF
jgi:hypothetical protein